VTQRSGEKAIIQIPKNKRRFMAADIFSVFLQVFWEHYPVTGKVFFI